MVGRDVTIRNCFRLGGFVKNKQENDLDVTEKPADLSKEDYEFWINVDTNLEKVEKLQKKQNVKYPCISINLRHFGCTDPFGCSDH
ncbi:hypothetical protein AVEN_24849-1 [Araneus ventricosus]|uniref:Uncharacterized protein n=1 Tax=Araneus ventricosus TaxID=182803 RepID=A0A4Y2BU88_ARAVE|nr:hypothetical protein AVEN_24849-1 [Araneus ventricosus]